MQSVITLLPMHLHLVSRCALLLLAALAGPAEALDNSHADVAARSGRQEPIADPINAAVTPMNGPAVGGQAPLVQSRLWARSETWRSSYRWPSTNGSLLTDLTEQTRHSARLAREYTSSNSSLRQAEDRSVKLFEGTGRYSAEKSFINKIAIGWTLSPSADLLPRQAWELRRSENDPLILRLRRGVLTVLAQRAF